MNATALLELFSLRDRVALITGAGGDIGRAISQGLATAGATIALNGRSADKLATIQHEIQEGGGASASFPADLSDLQAIPALVAAVVGRLGGIDILVNCAGTNQRMPILEMTPEIYEQIMATNLRGAYFLSRAVLPLMAAHGGGKIINIGSLTSTIGLADVSVYGMTKGALAQLTKTMAVEWAQHNVQVNCLCPGFIATELTVPLWSNPDRQRWMLDRLPAKRPGKPADLVGLTIYLASPASDYMTGQTIYVDGGFLAGSQW
jgi:2-deoxy-D-gluconate 3-dehydrogenase